VINKERGACNRSSRPGITLPIINVMNEQISAETRITYGMIRTATSEREDLRIGKNNVDRFCGGNHRSIEPLAWAEPSFSTRGGDYIHAVAVNNGRNAAWLRKDSQMSESKDLVRYSNKITISRLESKSFSRTTLFAICFVM